MGSSCQHFELELKPIRDTFQSGPEFHSLRICHCHVVNCVLLGVPPAYAYMLRCTWYVALRVFWSNYNSLLDNRFCIFLHTYLFFSCYHLLAAHIGDYFPALNEFSTHTVIRPQVQHGRTKRSLQSTLDASVSTGSCWKLELWKLTWQHLGQLMQVKRKDKITGKGSREKQREKWTSIWAKNNARGQWDVKKWSV